MKTFINAHLVLKDGLMQNGFLIEENGFISEIGDMKHLKTTHTTRTTNEEIIDCKGKYLSPGFIDLHTHGGGGHDFMDGTKQAIVEGARTHMRHGTTSIMPTTLTSSDEDLFKTIDAYHQAATEKENMPHLLGLHLEGPYFSQEYRGAQPEKYIINPNPKHYMRILEYAEGAVKRWSLAPELAGAIEMAGKLSQMGVMISAAHTSATYEQIKEAFEHGVASLTHFYLAMSGIVKVNGHRKLGTIESGYLIDGMAVELIADGVHLPAELLRLILRCKNHDEIFLATDSMRAAGMPDGKYLLGSESDGQEVIVEDGIAMQLDRSSFAGSVATADRLVRVMVSEVGLPVWEAVRMITLNPARLLGVDKEIGSLEVGKQADVVVFDEDVFVDGVYVGGNGK